MISKSDEMDGDRYYDKHHATYEEVLSSALEKAIADQAPDPIEGMINALKHHQRQTHQAQRQGMKTKVRITAEDAVAEAVSATGWTAAKWLHSLRRPIGNQSDVAESSKLGVADFLACTLVGEGDAPDELKALRLLGEMDTASLSEELRDRISDGINELVDWLCPALHELAGELPTPEMWQSKFEQNEPLLTFDGLDTFFSGLEGKVSSTS